MWLAITQLMKNKIFQWILVVTIALSCIGVLWNKYQAIKRDRESIAAQLAERTLAYENMAKENITLKTTVQTLKKKRFTIKVTLPDGTIIETTSEYTDSAYNSQVSGHDTQIPVFAPIIPNKAEVRYPLSLCGAATIEGWGVGPAWEVAKVDLPFVPYTHLIVGGTIGQTYTGSDLYMSGIVLIQWSKK